LLLQSREAAPFGGKACSADFQSVVVFEQTDFLSASNSTGGIRPMTDYMRTTEKKKQKKKKKKK
jgi:hypothetical protein